MAKALGQTPEEATAPGIEGLTKYLAGNVGLVLTNRPVEAVLEYFNNMSLVDFARAGTVASRTFAIPTGVVHATAGEVPAEYDIPLAHTLEPELRRLGVPTRMVKGKVVLGDESGEGEPHVVCKEGEVLDSRQTRLLKMFDVCLSEFKVRVVAYVFSFPPYGLVHINTNCVTIDTGALPQAKSQKLTRLQWMASRMRKEITKARRKRTKRTQMDL